MCSYINQHHDMLESSKTTCQELLQSQGLVSRLVGNGIFAFQFVRRFVQHLPSIISSLKRTGIKSHGIAGDLDLAIIELNFDSIPSMQSITKLSDTWTRD